MNVHLQHPEMLWLLAVLPAVVLMTLRSRAIIGKGRVISIVCRTTILVACLAALTQPVLEQQGILAGGHKVVLLVDRSQSVHDDAVAINQKRMQVLETVPKGTEVVELSFADAAWSQEESAGDPNRTNIETALFSANARSLDAPDTKVVLISDGRATEGDALGAANQLAMRGVKIHALAVGRQRPVKPRLISVEPPLPAQVGVKTGMRVIVEATAAETMMLTLRDSRGNLLDQCRLPCSGRKAAMLHFTPRSPGVETYVVQVELQTDKAARSYSQDPGDQCETLVYVDGPPRILLCDVFPEEAQPLRRALEPLHVPVDVVAPADWPSDLSPYAAVIISDWSGKELTAPQREALAYHVEEAGCGLVFIGGGNVLASRWQKNELRQLLPVGLLERPARVVKKTAPASVCFVLDRSASMSLPMTSSGGLVSKLDLVKASVISSIQCLPEKSQVAIVVFDDKSNVVLSPTSTDERKDIQDIVERIQVGGGTNMAPAIDRGIELLAKMPGDRYLVVLTDGQTESPLFVSWDDLVAGATSANVSWTSIAVGADADTDLMENLAKTAGGKYAFCGTADRIPQVFVQHAKAIRRIATEKQEPFQPRKGPQFDRLKNVTIDGMPLLQGSVPAKGRNGVDVLLLSDKGQPLLAQWQFGLGKVIAFTSDAKAGWARDWVTWPKYSTLWIQLVQNVLRPDQPFHVKMRHRMAGRQMQLTFQVKDRHGQPVSDLQCLSRELPAGRDVSWATWRSFADGEYQVTLDPPPGARRRVSLKLMADDRKAVQYSVYVGGSAVDELLATGPDLETLRAIAATGGGLCQPTLPSVALQADPQLASESRPTRQCWPWLLILAIALMPVDVAMRKWFSR